MLHMHKNPRAKAGVIAGVALVFGGAWGAVHAQDRGGAPATGTPATVPAISGTGGGSAVKRVTTTRAAAVTTPAARVTTHTRTRSS